MHIIYCFVLLNNLDWFVFGHYYDLLMLTVVGQTSEINQRDSYNKDENFVCSIDRNNEMLVE